jgi:hypothetical protein
MATETEIIISELHSYWKEQPNNSVKVQIIALTDKLEKAGFGNVRLTASYSYEFTNYNEFHKKCQNNLLLHTPFCIPLLKRVDVAKNDTPFVEYGFETKHANKGMIELYKISKVRNENWLFSQYTYMVAYYSIKFTTLEKMAANKKRGRAKKNVETKPEPVIATSVWTDVKFPQLDQDYDNVPVAEMVEPSAPSFDMMMY